jgi:hypothetical protein
MQYYVVVRKASQLMQYYVIAHKASLSMQCYVVVHMASLTIQHFVLCAHGVSLMTQHFEDAELCRRKAERLTHLIM